MKLDLYIISNYKITSYYFKGDELALSNELIENNNEFIIYTTDDGQVEIEVRLEDENVWLTQNSMAELFDTTRNNITMHIKNIFEEGELQENSVSKESLLTAKDGKKYKTKFYNLDLIISEEDRYSKKIKKDNEKIFFLL